MQPNPQDAKGYDLLKVRAPVPERRKRVKPESEPYLEVWFDETKADTKELLSLLYFTSKMLSEITVLFDQAGIRSHNFRGLQFGPRLNTADARDLADRLAEKLRLYVEKLVTESVIIYLEETDGS